MRKPYAPDIAMLLLLVALPTDASDLERALATLGYVWRSSGIVSSRLKQLVQQGLVSRTWDTSGNERPRLVYSITEAGVAYLQRVAIPR